MIILVRAILNNKQNWENMLEVFFWVKLFCKSIHYAINDLYKLFHFDLSIKRDAIGYHRKCDTQDLVWFQDKFFSSLVCEEQIVEVELFLHEDIKSTIIYLTLRINKQI